MEHLKAALASDVARRDYREALRNNAQSLAETLVQLGDHAGAAAVAETLASVFPDVPRDRYYAACFLARCVSLARHDARVGDAAARELRANRYAACAVSHLRAALAPSAQGLPRLPNEQAIFAPLEGFPGFAETLRQLDEQTKKP